MINQHPSVLWDLWRIRHAELIEEAARYRLSREGRRRWAIRWRRRRRRRALDEGPPEVAPQVRRLAPVGTGGDRRDD